MSEESLVDKYRREHPGVLEREAEKMQAEDNRDWAALQSRLKEADELLREVAVISEWHADQALNLRIAAYLATTQPKEQTP